VLAMRFIVRFVDDVPVAAFGLAFHEPWPRDLFTGIRVAVSMLGGLIIAAALIAHLDIRWTGPGAFGPWVLTVGILLLSAASEELMFRGYPMQVLMKGIVAWPAMLAMYTLFGVVHIFNPDVS